MKAVQVGERGTAKVSDVGEPKLRGQQDVIVKVTAAAICGADLFPLHGMTPGFDTRAATKVVLLPGGSCPPEVPAPRRFLPPGGSCPPEVPAPRRFLPP